MRSLNLLILLGLGLMVIYADHPVLVNLFQGLSTNPDENRAVIYGIAAVLGTILAISFIMVTAKTKKEKKQIAQNDAQRIDDFKRSARRK